MNTRVFREDSNILKYLLQNTHLFLGHILVSRVACPPVCRAVEPSVSVCLSVSCRCCPTSSVDARILVHFSTSLFSFFFFSFHSERERERKKKGPNLKMFFGTLLFAHPIHRSAVLSHPLSASAPVLLRHFTSPQPCDRLTDISLCWGWWWCGGWG